MGGPHGIVNHEPDALESAMDSRNGSSNVEARLDRRRFMAYFALTGLGGTLFPGVLWALGNGEVTKETIEKAEAIAGLEFTDEQREQMVRGLNRNREAYEALRTVELPNSVVPAIRFDPVVPGVRPPSTTVRAAGPSPRCSDPGPVTRPADLEEAAFWPVTKLAELIRTQAGHVARVDGDVPGPAEASRPHARVHDHAD